ncbi:MAG: carboxymuconolactone decarboxylase, partial [Ramlibacter sp.]|nr:carboxymuconolactone decarboxylase [Ramlibacter sp.]
MTESTPLDLIDALVPLPTGDAAHTLRHQRDKVVAATQGSYEAVFDPALPGLGLAERLQAAHTVADLSGGAALAAHYAKRLATLPAPAASPQLDAVLEFARTLAVRPVEGDRESLLRLSQAGLSPADVVTLAQLIALVAYQVRVVAGLQALATQGQGDAAPVAADASPFVHPAHLPPPGEALRINGYTSETLGWKAWLPVLDVAQATPRQKEILQASHPKAATSDYYLTLIQQPEILEQRSTVFNAIMYAPGGLSRAERELASAVVSRVNGCVYCAAVHAQRFEQLAKRN